MYYRFSGLARFTILFSFLLTASALIIHGYNLCRMIETNQMIFEEMARENVLRVTAIDYLERRGVNLFLDGELTTLTGIIFGLLALFCLYMFARDNSFFFAIAAAFFCLITTLISGLLLFFVIFSGKSEKSVGSGKRTFNSDWEKYISEKSRETGTR